MLHKKIWMDVIHQLMKKLFGVQPDWYRQRDLAANNYRLAQTYAAEGKKKEALFRLKILLWACPQHAEGLALRAKLLSGQTVQSRFEIAEEMDAKPLHELHKSAFPLYWKEGEISDMLMASGTKAWLLRSGTQPAGMLMTRAQFEQAEILTIAVSPNFRRSGVARRLMTHAEEALQHSGVKKIFLEVAEDNAAARALYQRLGYIDVSRRKGYYKQADGSVIDALVMSRELL